MYHLALPIIVKFIHLDERNEKNNHYPNIQVNFNRFLDTSNGLFKSAVKTNFTDIPKSPFKKKYIKYYDDNNHTIFYHLLH